MSDNEARLSNYRLHAPQYQAFDPSGLELAFAQQMTQPGASQLVGYLAGAGLDRQAGSQDYRLALGESNRQAMAAGDAAERAADLRNRRALVGRMLEHPDAAAVFGLSNAEIDPRMGNLAIDFALNRGDIQRSTALRNNAAAANDLSLAGVDPAPGVSFGPSGLPNAPRVQGVSRPERVAMINENGDGTGNSASLALRQQNTELRMHNMAMTEANRRVMLSARQHGLSGFRLEGGQFVGLGGEPLSPEMNARLEALRQQTYQEVLKELRGATSNRPAAAPSPTQNAPMLNDGSYTLRPGQPPPQQTAPAPPLAAPVPAPGPEAAARAIQYMNANGFGDRTKYGAYRDGTIRELATGRVVGRMPT